MILVATLIVEILPIKSQTILLNSCFVMPLAKFPPKKKLNIKGISKILKRGVY